MFFKQIIQKKKLLAIFFLSVLLGGFLITYYVLAQNNTTSESTIVRQGNLKDELTLSGKIEADEHVVLQFQTGGLLTFVGVKEGDSVKKFQAIASLDQRQVQKTLQKYLNTYVKTRQDFDQTKDTYKDVVISDTIKRTLQKSQSDLNNSVLDVELQDLSRQIANIWTPIDGIVIRVDAPQAGVNIYQPSQAQFEVVNPVTLYMQAAADQTEVINLGTGQKGTIVFDPYPDEKITGTIQLVSFSPKKDESGTVYTMKVNFPNSSFDTNKYRLGMTGDITFTTKEKSHVLYIPSKFIKTDNNGKYIFVGKEKKKTYVATGLETDTDVEIIGDIKKGDVIYD